MASVAQLGRVAVVGAGVSGSVSAALLRAAGLHVSLFERSSRTVGGRASRAVLGPADNQLAFDQGAQFVSLTDERFQRLAKSPLMEGLLRPWDGRLAVLGCASGTPSVLPRQAVLESKMFAPTPKRANKVASGGEDAEDTSSVAEQEEEKARMAVPMNFCGFLEGEPGSQLYVGAGERGLGGLCEGLLERVQLEPVRGANVGGVVLDRSTQQWSLDVDNTAYGGFDYLVLANHDPAFAANTLQQLRGGAPPGCEMALPHVDSAVGGFCEKLHELHGARSSRWTLMLAFDRALSELEFDAASLHGSESLSFISRDSAKRGGADGAECWVVHSTPQFAEWIDARVTGGGDDERQQLATQSMLEAFGVAVGGCFAEGRLPAPSFQQSRRWGRGFYDSTLQLNDGGGTHNDAVTFEPWRLALCADYLGGRQGVQEAALSGMMAADRVSEWAHFARAQRAQSND